MAEERKSKAMGKNEREGKPVKISREEAQKQFSLKKVCRLFGKAKTRIVAMKFRKPSDRESDWGGGDLKNERREMQTNVTKLRPMRRKS